MYTYIHKWGDNDERVLNMFDTRTFWNSIPTVDECIHYMTLNAPPYAKNEKATLWFADYLKELHTEGAEWLLESYIEAAYIGFSKSGCKSKIIHDGPPYGDELVIKPLKSSFLIKYVNESFDSGKMYDPIMFLMYSLDMGYAGLKTDFSIWENVDLDLFELNYNPFILKTTHWGEVHLEILPHSIFLVDEPFEGVPIVEVM